MTSTINKKDEHTLEVAVELTKEDLSKYIDEAELRIARDANIEGFRPGKAPKDVIRKKIGEEAIRQEALELAVQGSLGEILKKENLTAIDQEGFKIEENSKDKLKYKITVTIIPDIELGEYKGLNIERKKVESTKEEEEKVLEDLRKSRAKIANVTRGARMGDRIEIDFKLTHKGELIKDGLSSNHPVVLGETKLLPGFEEELIGMKPEDKKHCSIEVPKDYYNKDIAGKTIEVDAHMKVVQERTIPDLTDDFAKGLGAFDSVEALKENIKKGLRMEKDEREKSRIRVEMLSRVLENSKIGVPSKLVDQYLDAMIKDFDNELHGRGMELGLYLAHIKKTQDELRKEWRPQAERQAKMNVISREIAKREKFEVKEEEVEDELQQTLQRYHVDADPKALEKIDIDAVRSRIRNSLLTEKVFNLLEKHTKFDAID
ncbi:MAG: trigger factor [Parcubacteria group bacterium]